MIADNTGSHLVQRGEVGAVIAGADRVAERGDGCSKIGTGLKALVALDNGVAFHPAMPFSPWT